MRRALALVLVTALAAVASACSGADASEAQQLLAESNEAFAEVRSATFSARMTVTGAPMSFDMTMSGGGHSQGKRAGDFYVVATSESLPFGELVVVSKAGRVSMTLDGSPLGSAPVPQQSDNPIELVDLSRYVKDVDVEHGKLIGGVSMAKLSGVIDTAGLASGALADVTGMGDTGLDLSKALGDTRVVLYISESTH